MTTQTHHDKVAQQFGSQAAAYLTSAVHASGRDLDQLKQRLTALAPLKVLDMGCGAGHASFVAAQHAQEVIAYDLSEKMLAVVRDAALQRGLTHLSTQQGYAETLPFADSTFDVVISRYSAHHWHDVGKALREVKRVLKKNGRFIMMDIMSPGHVVLDIWLQTVEALRDTSHVRNYASGEWLQMVNQAGLITQNVSTDRIELAFSDWIARMRTSEALTQAIRLYQQSAADDVQRYFDLQADGSFCSDTIMLEAVKAH